MSIPVVLTYLLGAAAVPRFRIFIVSWHLPLAMIDELLRYRDQFPILATTTYLISNSLGAMPRGAADAMREYTDLWAGRGVRAWTDRW